MKIMLIGSSGMVGQGVLNACLNDENVTEIVLLARRSQPHNNPKIREIILSDLMNFQADESLADLDACFFCAGVTSMGMSENDYRKLTFDLTLHIAGELAKVREAMSFVYISGKGADANSTTMWAKVRGETENALLALPLKTMIFRPAFIMAEKGIQSKTALYAWIYRVLRPIVAAIETIKPLNLLTTQGIGKAMLNAVKFGESGRILDSKEIVALAKKD